MTMTTTTRRWLIIAALIGALGTSACVHRITIQQGNFLRAKDIERVEVGMTRVQIRALLGTPMVADPFHPSRWDYIYYSKLGRLQQTRRQHLIVFFDEQDKVARIDRAGMPPPATEVDSSQSGGSEPSA